MHFLSISTLFAGWAIQASEGYIPRPRMEEATCTKTTVAVLYVSLFLFIAPWLVESYGR